MQENKDRPLKQEIREHRDATEISTVITIVEGDPNGGYIESKPRYDQPGLRLHQVWIRDEDLRGETGYFIKSQWESFRQLLIGMNLNY